MPARPVVQHRAVGAAVLVVASAVAAPAEAQMLRTLFQRGGPGDPDPFGTVVEVRVDRADGRVRVVDDSARVHVFDRGGRRLSGREAARGWGPEPDAGAAVTVAAGVRVSALDDSAGVRIARARAGRATSERTFPLPVPRGETPGPRFRVQGVLADGAGRAWLRVCREEGCDDPEQWVVMEPPPDSTPEAAPTFTGMVLPARYRLEAVLGRRLIGVQGPPGRQALHVLEMYEQGRPTGPGSARPPGRSGRGPWTKRRRRSG